MVINFSYLVIAIAVSLPLSIAGAVLGVVNFFKK